MAVEAIIEFCGYELDSPLVNSAGLINGTNPESLLREVEFLAESAVGAVTVGSFTPVERVGNEEMLRLEGQSTPKVWVYATDTRAMTNALGLPNVGVDKASSMVGSIIEAAGDKPVIFSVSPANDTGDSSVDQAMSMIDSLYMGGARIIEVNVSCPNVVTEDGGRKPIMGYDAEAMSALMARIADVGYTDDLKLGLKVPPFELPGLETGISRAEIVEHIRETDAFDYVASSNTLPGNKPKDRNGRYLLTVPGNGGGMSGRPTAEQGLLETIKWVDELNGSGVDVSSTLGIFDGAELANRLGRGAVLGGAVTRFWVGGDSRRVADDILTEYAAVH